MICEKCGQQVPLEKPKLQRLSPIKELLAAVKGKPIAREFKELVTPKQARAIELIAGAAGMDCRKECLDALGCDYREMNKSAAHHFMHYLKRISTERLLAARKE
ncbi:MAG TPA: hypothetical protein VF762_23350 [Blastocatellia bacterium]|jgi:hypothetical protein